MPIAQSLLLITVDCLRADHVGFLGYGKPSTPFLDSLAPGSLVFRNAIAAGVPTYYSFPAIMGSRHPLALGRDVIGIAPGEPTMASALKESGYATAAFLAGNPYLSKRFGYEAGFDTFVDFLDADLSQVPDDLAADVEAERSRSRFNRLLRETFHKLGPVGRVYDQAYFRYCQWIANRDASSFDTLRRFPAADVIAERAHDWLKEHACGPFFLWLHFMDPHAPYYPPPQATALMGHREVAPSRARYLNSYWNRGDLNPKDLERHREEIIALYDAGIRWVDSQVERLVDGMRNLGVADTCVMAVTADHGEEFLDHGGRFHSPSRTNEELSHVPLLVHVPGLSAAKPVNSAFSLIDLAPTLLEIVDVPGPFSFRGQSRWSSLKSGQSWEEPAITESVMTCTNPFRLENRFGRRMLGIRDEHYKLVINCESGSESLFDLRTDQKELHPLPPDRGKAVRHRFLDRARQHLADSLQSRDFDSRLAARLHDVRLEWSQTPTPSSC